MKRKSVKEGLIKACGGCQCGCSCCDYKEVEEWIIEYCAFHDRVKDYLKEKGVKLKFVSDVVRFYNCSDGKNCKLVKYATNKQIDLRPIDCKIYPYAVDWHTIDFDKRTIKICWWDNDCPLVKNKQTPADFKEEVMRILRRDFSLLFYGMDFSFEFVDKTLGRTGSRKFGNKMLNPSYKK